MNLAWAAARGAEAAARGSASLSAPPPPIITSTGKHVYQNGVATNFVGTPGEFTLSDSGPVTGYIYGFGTVPVNPPTPAGPDGTLTLSITPNSEVTLDLEVEAVNGSSPPSQPTSFVIETRAISGIATLAWWKLNVGHGLTASDATAQGHGALLSKGQSWSCAKPPAPDGYRCAMRLNGRGDAQTNPALLSVVFTRINFTVSAWVNLSRCVTTCVALSEDGFGASMFTLGCRAHCALGKAGCWEFTVGLGPPPAKPLSVLAPVGRRSPYGRWVQLTGEFEPVSLGITLDVNGVQRAQSTVEVVPVADNGIVRLGAGFNGAHPWNGRLSNACLFFNALPPADVTLLFTGDAVHPHNGCAAEFAKYP